MGLIVWKLNELCYFLSIQLFSPVFLQQEWEALSVCTVDMRGSGPRHTAVWLSETILAGALAGTVNALRVESDVSDSGPLGGQELVVHCRDLCSSTRRRLTSLTLNHLRH